jgi:hypothetical protein
MLYNESKYNNILALVGNKANRYQYPSKREEGYLHGLSFESHLSGFEIREHFVCPFY